jgi:nucleoside-diphosphate-sugar epimerase
VAGRSFSNKEVAEIVASKTNAKIVFKGSDDSPSYFYKIDPLYQQLDFRPAYSLEQILLEMIQE